MTNYYTHKRKMYQKLEFMLKNAENGINPDFLVYNLTNLFDISEKSIEKRLELLERMGSIKLDVGVYIWIKDKEGEKNGR